jgi:hypothetical protein
VVATFLVHGDTLRYGLDYDDYYFLRPYAAEEVLASFHGSWDHTGVMVPFYRPLTVAFSALRFEVFGLNSVVHHAMSLAMFTVAALMVAWLVYRWTSRAIAAVLATALFVCHPAMPYSLVAWITNQMHLLQMLVLLSALVWWDAIRARGLLWWLPLLILGIVAFLIKEDGVVLLPTIIVLHECRRRVMDRASREPWAFLASSVVLIALLMAFRGHVLGELGGYSRPSPASGWRNLSTTLWGLYRLVPADRDWQPIASVFVTWLPLAALAAWRWISPAARFCLAGGAATAIVVSLPLVFGTKPEQVYMVAFALVLVLTGAALAMLDLASRSRSPRFATLVASAILAAGIGSLGIVTRAITRDFEPFGPIVLAHDNIVRTWGFVAPELREYLERKREAGAPQRLSPNPLDELSIVTFNVHGRDVSPDGIPYMWMAGTRSEIHLASGARTVVVPLRHAIEAFREGITVKVEANGRLTDEIPLTTSEWRYSTTALRAADVPRVSRMHRIRIAIGHAWRPTDIIPGSIDGRILGLQIGAPMVK